MPTTNRIAAAHNAMAMEYDQLNDLWYPWLFSRIHEAIGAELSRLPPQTGKSLDVGCGTGFQTFLASHFGYDAVGLDIAADLVDCARAKQHLFAHDDMPPLFQTNNCPRWLRKHHRWLSGTAKATRGDRRIGDVEFRTGSAEEMAFGASEFDVITCCGSVLSFVDGHADIVAKMSEYLRVGGMLFIEVEQRETFDLAWAVVDNMTGKFLGYDQTFREALTNLFGRRSGSTVIKYPFELRDGSEVTLPIKLFDIRYLENLWATAGLEIVSRVGVHSITNGIPSVLLHECSPSRTKRAFFSALRLLEDPLGSCWPFSRLGCSVIYSLRRVPSGK